MNHINFVLSFSVTQQFSCVACQILTLVQIIPAKARRRTIRASDRKVRMCSVSKRTAASIKML